jgi:hypothetical protein
MPTSTRQISVLQRLHPCALFSVVNTILHPRQPLPLLPGFAPLLRLKRCHAWDQRQSSQVFILLPVGTVNYAPTLKIDDRVDDLISRLSDTDIPHWLTAREGGGGSPGPGPNVSAIGVPEYDWGVNCIHGVQTTCGVGSDGTVRAFRQKCTLDGAIGSHACSLQASRRVTNNGIPLGCSLLLPVHIVNCVQPLKANHDAQPPSLTLTRWVHPSIRPCGKRWARSSAKNSVRCGCKVRKRRPPGQGSRTLDWIAGPQT